MKCERDMLNVRVLVMVEHELKSDRNHQRWCGSELDNMANGETSEVLHNNKQTSRTVTRLLAVHTRTWLSFIIYKYHKSSQGSCCVIIITSLLFIDPTNKIITQYSIAISVLAMTVDWPKPSEQKALEVNTTNKHTKNIQYPAKKII